MSYKSFENDRLVRASNGRPIGRVVLAEPYQEGARVPVSLLTVPKGPGVALRGVDYYIDGVAYRIQADLPAIRVTEYSNKWVVNSFFLERVE